MSGQWEVVGKKKEKGSKDLNLKVGKPIIKSKTVNANVKVEDVCKLKVVNKMIVFSIFNFKWPNRK